MVALRNQQNTFSGISDPAWEAFIDLMRPMNLAAGDCLLRAGQPARYLAYIVKGSMREYYATSEGSEFNKAFVLSGSFTGSLFDLLSGEPSTVSIQALKDCELLVAPFIDFQKLYDTYPCWERAGRLLTESLFMKKARREHEFLTMSAWERYQSLLREYPDLEQQVPQYHIASYLGITPVMLSRLRRR
ncbi:hypothetical protein BTA51_20590 [Hahella sp. CCB-MM4]|nr:hypothetical protein BTA51_20590 [Hahella sp. CCB-MM4]